MKPNITVLPNGLRVVSLKYPQIETVSLGIWVNTGSAYECADMNGISHFLEHMVFKGTPSRNARDISEEIENVGGQTNAYTSREFTAFYAKMLKTDAELAMNVLSDMLQNSSFPEDELLKEREVVVQEIKQTFDDPSDIVFDYMQDKAFANQAMGRPILGTAELVRSYDAKKLRAYMQSNYAANNMVVCAVGNIEHDDFLKMVEKNITNIPSKTTFVADTQNYTGGYFFENRDNEQAQVVLAFEGFNFNSPHYYATMILSTILGGGMSSRLFQEIREKRGLVYSIYSFPSTYTQNGLFGIAAGTDDKEINNMLPIIVDEIKKISNDFVSSEELLRAKAQIKAAILMGLESSSTVTEKLARQLLLFGRNIPIEETVAAIEKVNFEDIRTAASKIFSSNPSYSLVGNIGGHTDYDALKKLLATKQKN